MKTEDRDSELRDYFQNSFNPTFKSNNEIKKFLKDRNFNFNTGSLLEIEIPLMTFKYIDYNVIANKINSFLSLNLVAPSGLEFYRFWIARPYSSFFGGNLNAKSNVELDIITIHIIDILQTGYIIHKSNKNLQNIFDNTNQKIIEEIL